MVDPRGPCQEAKSRRAGLWSTELGGSVPQGRLVELRGPRPDDESRRAGWSNPQTPCMEAESCQPGCLSTVDRSRRLSPAVQAGQPPRPGAKRLSHCGPAGLSPRPLTRRLSSAGLSCPGPQHRAQRLSPAVQAGRPPPLCSVRRSPLGRLVDPTSPNPDVKSSRVS